MSLSDYLESWLSKLLEEREKFGLLCNEKAVSDLVAKLVEIGHYPPFSKTGQPALKMVEYYGVNWNDYSEPLECPHCQQDLRDHENGPPFKLEILWKPSDKMGCPECRGLIYAKGHRDE